MFHRRLSATPTLLLFSALTAFTLSGGRAEEPEIDFGILGVDVSVRDEMLDLVIHFVDDVPLQDATWMVPIRIFFNGAIYEPDHGVSASVVTGPQICPGPVDGECEQPESPCAETSYSYKSTDPVFVMPWSCRFFEGDEGPADDDCRCTRPFFRPASLPKSFAAPEGPGLFEFVVDPDGLYEEIDETNNTFAFEYHPATPARVATWGAIKSTYR